MIAFGKAPIESILASIWPDVADILVERGEEWLCENDLSQQDLFVNILSGEWDLWLATEDTVLKGVVVTAIREDALRVLWAGGENLEQYLFLGLCMLERYALSRGVDNVTMGGRKGWGKILNPLNYHPVPDGYGKNLTAAYLH